MVRAKQAGNAAVVATASGGGVAPVASGAAAVSGKGGCVMTDQEQIVLVCSCVHAHLALTCTHTSAAHLRTAATYLIFHSLLPGINISKQDQRVLMVYKGIGSDQAADAQGTSSRTADQASSPADTAGAQASVQGEGAQTTSSASEQASSSQEGSSNQQGGVSDEGDAASSRVSGPSSSGSSDSRVDDSSGRSEEAARDQSSAAERGDSLGPSSSSSSPPSTQAIGDRSSSQHRHRSRSSSSSLRPSLLPLSSQLPSNHRAAGFNHSRTTHGVIRGTSLLSASCSGRGVRASRTGASCFASSLSRDTSVCRRAGVAMHAARTSYGQTTVRLQRAPLFL